MRKHVEFQTFRPRLPKVYYARVHDHLLLRAQESRRSNVHLCHICVTTNAHSSPLQSVCRTSYFQSIRESPQFIIRGRERAKSLHENFDRGKRSRIWMKIFQRMHQISSRWVTKRPSPDRRAASRHLPTKRAVTVLTATSRELATGGLLCFRGHT